MNDETTLVLLEAIRQEFIRVKSLAEDAFYQLLRDDNLYHDPFPRHGRYNEKHASIGVIMQHVTGNLRSRFTDFFTTDGEKPGRDRDKEFVRQYLEDQELIQQWNEAWLLLFLAISEIETDPKLFWKTVTIRQQPLTVYEAFLRQLTHYGYHAGQIVLMAKELRGDKWQTLSIPVGKSAEYLTKAPERKSPQ